MKPLCSIENRSRTAGCAYAALCVSLFLFVQAACDAEQEEPDIKDVVAKDQIPAIWKPTFVTADEARIDEESSVIGVEIAGQAHCYSLILLNHHEIVNDEVGGKKIAVTW